MTFLTLAPGYQANDGSSLFYASREMRIRLPSENFSKYTRIESQ